MKHPELDRSELSILPLKDRANKVFIEKDHIPLGLVPEVLSGQGAGVMATLQQKIAEACENERSVMQDSL